MSGGSRGYCFLAELVGILQRRPLTIRQLFDVLPGIGVIPLQRVVSELVHGGVLRVADWRREQKHGKPSRVFGVGSEPGVLPPPRSDGRASLTPAHPIPTRRKLAVRRSMAGRFCTLWHALDEPKSARMVAIECVLSEHDCRFALHALRRARLVRVAEMIRENKTGLATAFWVRGYEALPASVVASPCPPAGVRRFREEIAA